MILTIQSTDHICDVNGAPARLWHGVTPQGAKVIAYVALVAVPDEVAKEFESELIEQYPDVARIVNGSVKTQPAVHVLVFGHAICGLPGLPGEWPAGSTWVGIDEKERATCAACRWAVPSYQEMLALRDVGEDG